MGTKTKKSEFDILELIGEGAFGKVYLGVNRKTQEEVAIKCDECKNDNFVFQVTLTNEYSNMKEMGPHENIVRVIDRIETENIYHLTIVFELLDLDLADFMDEYHCDGLPLELISRFTRHILQALAFLQKNHILHRDIKPANLMLDLNTNTLKLCDFGHATYVTSYVHYCI